MPKAVASPRWLLAGIACLTCCWPAGLAAQEQPTRRGLLIGIGDYEASDSGSGAGVAPVPDLQAPVNDVLLIRRVLITRYGFRPEDLTVLTDAGATRAAILAALETLVEQTGPDDVVYVHFSGHGSRISDRNGDEADGWDDTVLSYDARSAGVRDILDDELDAFLQRLPARDVLAVMDVGRTPTLTAPGSDIRVRGVGPDPREQLYDEEPADTGSVQRNGSYVMLDAAAPGQYGLEGRISHEHWFGWFSWSLARALATGPQDRSIDRLHAEIQDVMNNLGDLVGVRSPGSRMKAAGAVRENAVLGGDRLEAGGRPTADRAWANAEFIGSGEVLLEQGSLLGAGPGSLWAVYPPDTSSFTAEAILATAEVTGHDGDDARAKLDGGGTVPAGSRAVLLAPAPPPTTVSVWLRRVSGPGGETLRDALSASPRVKFVESARGARFIVNIDDRGCRVYGPGGLQLVEEFQEVSLEETTARLLTRFERSVRLAHLQALDNPAGAMRVTIDVNPIDVDGMPRLSRVPGLRDYPAFRVRDADEPRAPDNSLIMSLRVSQAAYVTVVDIGPEGSVSPLFPNPVSDQNDFYPDGRIPFGQEIRVPDSLTSSNAGFYIDYEPPPGPDTLRVFAAGDPLTAARIRDYLGRYVAWAEEGGEAPDFQDLFLPVVMPVMKEVGTALTGFGESPGSGVLEETVFGNWSASSVSFRIGD